MKIHIIKKGETLYALSKKYGVSMDQLIALNPQLTDPNQVQVGMKIRVPSTPVSTGGYEIIHKHVVKEGDTLWKLAKAWGIPLQALIAANPQLKNPNVLLIGQVVNIPKLTVNEASGPSASAGWGANAANTGVVPLSKAELTKPILPQPPVQPPVPPLVVPESKQQPPMQTPVLPESKLQPPAPQPSQPQAQAKPPLQSQQSQPQPKIQPQFKPQAEQLIPPSPLPISPSLKPAAGNMSPVKPTSKGESPNFAVSPTSYENYSANMPNVEPYPNSFAPNYSELSQSNMQWQSQEVGGLQSASQPNVHPNLPQYEGSYTMGMSPYSSFCNPYPVHQFAGHHCDPCSYPSYGAASIPFMSYHNPYSNGINPMWGGENVIYSENAKYGPTAVSPVPNTNYSPASVSPDANVNYGPGSVASTANQNIFSSDAGELWDKKVKEQGVNTEAYAVPQVQSQYSNVPYGAQEYAYGASPYVDCSVFCHQCGTPYRLNAAPVQDNSWLSQWGDVSSGTGNEAEFTSNAEEVPADIDDNVSCNKGKKKGNKEQRKNASTRSYREFDSYTQASARPKGKSMPWING